MTDAVTPVEPDPQPDGSGARRILIAAAVAVLVILGLKWWFTRWSRRGGPRRAISQLAEDGAVKLADAVLDEVLGPAA